MIVSAGTEAEVLADSNRYISSDVEVVKVEHLIAAEDLLGDFKRAFIKVASTRICGAFKSWKATRGARVLALRV